MKVIDLRNDFEQSLSLKYVKEEVNSFFYLLSEAYLGWNRIEVTLNLKEELSQDQASKFKSASKRLLNYEPIQYILGETEFMDITFRVTPATLIPRPETEELVRWVIDEYQDNDRKLQLLDIGTGSGCIAISLAKFISDSKISAMDISEDALEVARLNAQLANVNVNFIQKDILEIQNSEAMYDIIVSNPPYVRESEKVHMQKNVLNFEPQSALYVPDENPLLFYEKIAKYAKLHLKDGGLLFFEINQYLSKELVEMLENRGFSSIEVKQDFFGKDRMIKCSLHERS